ncbi:MAG: NADH-quinone oxidoreductase subunit L, partial [Ignavibacteriota bacterium]
EGKERFGNDKHPHESPAVMTIPLMVLALLAAIGGFIGIPEIFSGEHGNQFHNFLAPLFKDADRKLATYNMNSHFEEILLMILSVAFAVSAIWFARYVYLKKPSIAANSANKFKGIYNLLWNKYFVDEVYDAVVVNPILQTSRSFLWKIADNKIIDGVVNGAAKIVDIISFNIRKLQTGIAQFYALVMMLGIVVALFWIILSL